LNISPAQSRAARGLLRWSQAELGASANLSKGTIRDFENGQRVPSINNLDAIRRALECAGVVFVVEFGLGVGVRFRLSHERLANGRDVSREREHARLFRAEMASMAYPLGARAQSGATEEERITGDQVATARKLLGWTPMDLAFHLGVSETTIVLFERGVRRLPALDICELLKVFEGAGVEFTRDAARLARKPDHDTIRAG
jgi:transcriptional regulator with XRE-family HTH domain